MMKHLFTACLLGATLAASAQTAAEAPKKVGVCQAEANAKSLKGEERKTFVTQCQAAQKEARAAQQAKMKACAADAKTKALKGDERKAFLKECAGK